MCYERVAEEFAVIVALHQELQSLLGVVSGDLAEDIQRYRQLLQLLLNRSEEAATQEQLLRQSIAITALTVANLDLSVARFEANITSADRDTRQLMADVAAQEALLQLLHSRLSSVRQLLESSLLSQLQSAQMLHMELRAAVSTLITHHFRSPFPTLRLTFTPNLCPLSPIITAKPADCCCTRRQQLLP